MIAGAFAIIPVEKASTVHTTIISSITGNVRSADVTLLDGVILADDQGIMLYDGRGLGNGAQVEVNGRVSVGGGLCTTGVTTLVCVETLDTATDTSWAVLDMSADFPVAPADGIKHNDSTSAFAVKLVNRSGVSVTFADGDFVSVTIVAGV